MPSAPSLTIVVIAYNAGRHIESTLTHLETAIRAAAWPHLDVLVVDDGSTDDTASRVTDFATRTGLPIHLERQPNSGRLAARRKGTELATGEYVCYLDVRMCMHPDSLANLQAQLIEFPQRRAWNCHIEVPAKGNVQAQFWNALTYVGWRRYLASPRLVAITPTEFDYFPTGTGGFTAPRALLLSAYQEMASVFDTAEYASDDTALLRYVNEHETIWMTPTYSADYIARPGLRGFVHHTFDRGVMFIDSYLRPGTRLFWPTIAVLAASAPALALAICKPKVLAALPLGVGAATAGLAAVGVRRQNLPGFALLAPVFALAFTAGMWKGLALMVRSRSQRRR